MEAEHHGVKVKNKNDIFIIFNGVNIFYYILKKKSFGLCFVFWLVLLGLFCCVKVGIREFDKQIRDTNARIKEVFF